MAAIALVQPTFAESQCEIDPETPDYALFEQWLHVVYAIAPSYGLKLHLGAEDEEEFFYLYCWQSDDDHSPENCVRMAKRVWENAK